MNEAPEQQSKRRFPWFVATLSLFGLIILLGLLFPAVSGHGPARRHIFARNDARQLRTAMKAYYTEYGFAPTGTNAQIMAILRGNNQRKIVFFEAAANQFNSSGEFLDPWGLPFRLGASTGDDPWAYSFGKNRIDEGGAEGSDDVASWR